VSQRLGFSQSVSLCFQVKSQVTIGRVEAGMAEPMCDGAEVNACAQQMDGGAVAEAVGM